MTRWEHFKAALGFPTREIVVTVRPDRMSEKAIDRALRVPEEQPTYRAFMQLLEDGRDEAMDLVATDPGSRAMHAGGAKYLKAVRDQVIGRRQVKRG